MSGGSISMSRKSAGDGSSSTTIARFSSAARNRSGIAASASATRRSNWTRFTARCARRRTALMVGRPEIVTRLPNHALVAQRLRPTDAPSVQNECIRRARPLLLRERLGKLLLDEVRIVGFGDADPVRHAKYVSIDRECWYPKVHARGRRSPSFDRRSGAPSTPPCLPAPFPHGAPPGPAPCRRAPSISARKNPVE